MKKWFAIIGFYIMAPFLVFADFSDILPRKTKISGTLPTGDIATHFLPRFIDIMIKIAYTVSVGFIVYAALLYFIAHGNDGDTKKAKYILIYSAIGFIIISISYAIVQSITNITWSL